MNSAPRHRTSSRAPEYASRLNSAGAHSRHPLANGKIHRRSRQVPVRRGLQGASVRRGAGTWGCRCEKFFFSFDGRVSRTPYWLVLLTVLFIDSLTFGLVGGFELLDGDAMDIERRGPSRLLGLVGRCAIALGRPRRVREALARSRQIGLVGASQSCAGGRLAVARSSNAGSSGAPSVPTASVRIRCARGRLHRSRPLVLERYPAGRHRPPWRENCCQGETPGFQSGTRRLTGWLANICETESRTGHNP